MRIPNFSLLYLDCSSIFSSFSCLSEILLSLSFCSSCLFWSVNLFIFPSILSIISSYILHCFDTTSNLVFSYFIYPASFFMVSRRSLTSWEWVWLLDMFWFIKNSPFTKFNSLFKALFSSLSKLFSCRMVAKWSLSTWEFCFPLCCKFVNVWFWLVLVDDGELVVSFGLLGL